MIVLYSCQFCFAECSANPTWAKPVVCKTCGRAQMLRFTESQQKRNEVDECSICHRQDFYVRDDVRKGMGPLALLVGLFLAYFTYGVSLIPGVWGFYWFFLKYPHLTVCYHCYAKYRNARRNPQHKGYDPEFGERLEKHIRDDRSFPQLR